MIDTVVGAYFEIFTKESFLLIISIGIVATILYTVYNSIK